MTTRSKPSTNGSANDNPNGHDPTHATATLADFIFVDRDRRHWTTCIQRGFRDAITAAGLSDPDGRPLKAIKYQMRHTWATELANAGMSIQALMTLLGHRSPEMTIRYARLASPGPSRTRMTRRPGRSPVESPSPPPGGLRSPVASNGSPPRCSIPV